MMDVLVDQVLKGLPLLHLTRDHFLRLSGSGNGPLEHLQETLPGILEGNGLIGVLEKVY